MLPKNRQKSWDYRRHREGRVDFRHAWRGFDMTEGFNGIVENEIKQIIVQVDNFVDTLPEPLRAMGQDFAVNGYPYRKAFLQNDWAFPGLHVPFWLSEKYNLTSSTSISNAEKDEVVEIVRAAIFGYLYIRIQDDVYDYKKGNKPSWLLLANEFINESFSICRGLFPEGSSFWNYFRKAWLDFSQATAWEIENCRGKLNPLTDENIFMVGKKLSFAKVPAAAVVLKAGQEEGMPVVFRIIDLLATSSQLLNDFGSIDRDLETEHFTYPLANTLASVNRADLKDSLYTGLLMKNPIESLFNKVIQLDNEILFILNEFILPPLSDFIKNRILLVEDMRKRYLEIKFNVLIGK